MTQSITSKRMLLRWIVGSALGAAPILTPGEDGWPEPLRWLRAPWGYGETADVVVAAPLLGMWLASVWTTSRFGIIFPTVTALAYIFWGYLIAVAISV